MEELAKKGRTHFDNMVGRTGKTFTAVMNFINNPTISLASPNATSNHDPTVKSRKAERFKQRFFEKTKVRLEDGLTCDKLITAYFQCDKDGELVDWRLAQNVESFMHVSRVDFWQVSGR